MLSKENIKKIQKKLSLNPNEKKYVNEVVKTLSKKKSPGDDDDGCVNDPCL